MRDLLAYDGTIYDANCLVYYVFYIQESDSVGNSVIIEGPYTGRARRITEILLAKRKKIRTLRVAWEEAEKVTISSALKEAIRDGSIQQRLGLKGKPTSMFEYRLAGRLRAELAGLKRQVWLLIEPAFVPDPARISALKKVYEAFCLDPEKQKLVPPGKGDPSFVDLSLVLFSSATKLPLLTNDRELYNFSTDLKTMGFCELIKAFPHVDLHGA